MRPLARATLAVRMQQVLYALLVAVGTLLILLAGEDRLLALALGAAMIVTFAVVGPFTGKEGLERQARAAGPMPEAAPILDPRRGTATLLAIYAAVGVPLIALYAIPFAWLASVVGDRMDAHVSLVCLFVGLQTGIFGGFVLLLRLVERRLAAWERANDVRLYLETWPLRRRDVPGGRPQGPSRYFAESVAPERGTWTPQGDPPSAAAFWAFAGGSNVVGAAILLSTGIFGADGAWTVVRAVAGAVVAGLGLALYRDLGGVHTSVFGERPRTRKAIAIALVLSGAVALARAFAGGA